MFNITLFSLLFFSILNVCSQGFVAGTLVKTPQGYIPIEQIRPGNQVLSYNYRNAIVPCSVQAIYSYEVDQYIEVITPNNFIGMGLTQRLFLPKRHEWIQASELTVTTGLLQELQETELIVDNVITTQRVRVYDLSIEPFHNFYVSTDDICVHNITFGIGEAAIYLGLSNPATFTPTVAILGGISIIAAGAALANKVIYDNRRAKQREIESSVEYRFNDPYRPNFYINGKPAHYSIDKIVDSFRNPYIAQFNPGYETPEAIGKAVYDNVLAGSKDEKFARKMQQEAIAAAKQIMHQMSSSAHTSPTQSSIVQSKQNQKPSSVGKTIDNAQALAGKAANEVKPSNASRVTSFSKNIDAKPSAFIPASKDANSVIVTGLAQTR